MIKERHLNIFVLGLLIFVPFFAYWNDQPFTITLMTRAVIFAIAAVGLNLALGIGGFISFGHAAFFGLGGYVMGILAWHSQNYVTLFEWPILIEGTKSMPIIWIITIAASAFLVAVKALNKVDFPTFGKPTIPHLNPIQILIPFTRK